MPRIVLAGCGGTGYGCDAAIKVEPVAACAGRYRAAFKPTGATMTFDLTVATGGAVTGNAVDAGLTLPLGSYSQAGNVRNGCTLEGTVLSLSYTTGETAGKSLRVTHDQRGALVGTYGGTLYDGSNGTVGERSVIKGTS